MFQALGMCICTFRVFVSAVTRSSRDSERRHNPHGLGGMTIWEGVSFLFSPRGSQENVQTNAGFGHQNGREGELGGRRGCKNNKTHRSMGFVSTHCCSAKVRCARRIAFTFFIRFFTEGFVK